MTIIYPVYQIIILYIEKNNLRTSTFSNAITLLSKYNKPFDVLENKKGGTFKSSSHLVPLAQLITNQVYLDFKKLYDLKPVLEEAGLYPIVNNNQPQARI